MKSEKVGENGTRFDSLYSVDEYVQLIRRNMYLNMRNREYLQKAEEAIARAQEMPLGTTVGIVLKPDDEFDVSFSIPSGPGIVL